MADKKQRNCVPSIELLAPGGDSLAVKAAIIAGADAVYCGLPSFNARQRAENITIDRLKKLIVIAHQNGAKLYLTLNTLILENEFDTVVEILAELQGSGIDAVIVQDVGLLAVLRKYFPAMEVHASTQMTTHNAGQLRLLAQLGVTQVNLCRELSLSEIGVLCDQAGQLNIKCEVFVHGAWCISFSGQCYFSSAISGHSGNRGACVQPCRRAWQGSSRAKNSVPFNLKDNSAFARLKELADARVASLKIEGRIKNYSYVYATVAAWRRQLERFFAGLPLLPNDPALHTVFNRRFHSGYLDSAISRSMFTDSSRDRSLEKLSRILNYTADTSLLRLEKEISVHPDTSVLIYTPDFTFVCTGFLVRKVHRYEYELRITHKLKGKIKSGDILYCQKNSAVPDDLLQRLESLDIIKRPLDIAVKGSAGSPLVALFTVEGKTVTVATDEVLTVAQKHSIDEVTLSEKMSMLGDTEFILQKIDCSELDAGLFIPIRAINDLRRKGVLLLTGDPSQKTVQVQIPSVKKIKSSISEGSRSLALLVNTVDDLSLFQAEQVRCCFELPVTAGDRIDFHIELFRSHRNCIPWFPSILIGDHFTAAVRLLERLEPALIVTDNSGIGFSAAERGIPWIAGPLLNCTNSYSIHFYQKYGKGTGAFVSNELSREQMQAVNAPEEFSRWYTLFAPLLLFSTRQCIVRNCIGCDKERFDNRCLASCEKSVTVTDNKKNPVYVVKRPGFYTQVYNGRHYFCPKLPGDVRGGGATVFLCDLRSLPSQTVISGKRMEMVKQMIALVNGDKRAYQRLRRIVRTTTAGQYTRGI